MDLKTLELTPQPWQNKPMLGPLERQQKKEYQAKIQDLKTTAFNFEKEIQEMLKKSAELERKGRLLLPRISLSLPIYNNFKVKLAAARHKQNLLENMTLDEIKNGLFGTNMKETLLNKDQMEAIHASLRDRKIQLKDTTSLQKLVDNILNEEEELFQQDLYIKQQVSFLYGPGSSKIRKSASLKPPVITTSTIYHSPAPPTVSTKISLSSSSPLPIAKKNQGVSKSLKEEDKEKSSTPKLPPIPKRFQAPQQSVSHSEKKVPIKADRLRRFSSGSHINMTNENSPRESPNDSIISNAFHNEKNKNINIKITTSLPFSYDMDESSVISNITTSPHNQSPISRNGSLRNINLSSKSK